MNKNIQIKKVKKQVVLFPFTIQDCNAAYMGFQAILAQHNISLETIKIFSQDIFVLVSHKLANGVSFWECEGFEKMVNIVAFENEDDAKFWEADIISSLKADSLCDEEIEAVLQLSTLSLYYILFDKGEFPIVVMNEN